MAKTKRLGKGLGNIIASGSGKKPTKNKKSSDSEKPDSKNKKGTVSTYVTVMDNAGNVSVAADHDYMDVPVNRIDPNPYQPRKDLNEEDIKSLAESIRSEGLMQAITVRPNGDRYELIAGERRFRACELLELPTIAARVTTASDSSSAVMSLIENLQRKDLNPIEEALGYASLMKDFSLTQDDVAERLGKARPSIANALRLLGLNNVCRGYLRTGMISVGHAKVLLGIETPERQTILARKAIEDGLSVREMEQVIKKIKSSGRSGPKTQGISDEELATIKDIESRVSTQLKTRVQLKHAPKKGKLIIEYYGNDDLQRVLEKIGIE